MWYIYIVQCSDESLYCGITKDVLGRVKKHNTGKGAKYTRSRRPVSLVDFSPVSTSKSDALKIEHAFKRLSRKKKIDTLSTGVSFFVLDYFCMNKKNQGVSN